LANEVVNTVTHWSPKTLLAAGFGNRCPAIRLSERGSGFYAWKPFIIQKKLDEAPEGEIIFYCDVGRTFPYKLLSGSLQVFLDWMKTREQSVMPGIQIPWGGPMSMWTKRDAFVLMSMDSPQVHTSSPIQASFSIWINNLNSRNIINEWMAVSAERQMISDDPSKSHLPELLDFLEHRHDQSLLSLVCLKRGLKPIDLGANLPDIDTKHPTEVASLLSGKRINPALKGKFVERLASLIEKSEWLARKWIKFNKPSQVYTKFK
jgi:hypothetical protein